MDSAYDTLARLIEDAASDANMIFRGRPARAKLTLPMPPWFDSTCHAVQSHESSLATSYKAQTIRTHSKKGIQFPLQKETRSHEKTIANKVTNLILRHILTVAKLERKKLFTAFLDLTAAYDSVQREKLWAHLQNIYVPEYLLSAIRALY